MHINDEGLSILKESEGLRLSAYLCPAGIWTIGYGSTRLGGKPVKAGDAITAEQAEAQLRADLGVFERFVSGCVTVPLTANQFSALVCLVYNIGTGAFAASTLLKRLNAGAYGLVADEFPKWCKAGGKPLPGLKIRRGKERALFLKP